MSHLITRPGLALTAGAALLLAAGPALSAAAAVPPTLTVKINGTGTPGKVLTGTVTGQANTSVTLSVDHGFFTSGEPTSTTVGDEAGHLVSLGKTLTVQTDGSGAKSFQLGIERDAGFDDDGEVDAIVTAAQAATTKTATAAWSSSNPLNAGKVDVALSSYQENPVAPTVSGDRTYFHVTTRDQFGNPVSGEPVELNFDKSLQHYDYGPEADFTSTLGDLDDFWMEYDVPKTLTADVIWPDAPTYTYTDGTGDADSGTPADKTGKASVDYYDVSFNGSSYSLTSSVAPAVLVGSTATQTVTVTDQLGRPVRGYDVQFFRFGPDSTGGERVGQAQTNTQGQASYSYVGSTAGTARVTAVVSDGLARRTLSGETAFRYNVPVAVSAKKGKGSKDSKGKDVLQVSADPHAAGAAVSVFRVVGGTLKPVPAKGGPLDGSGQGTFKVKDKNGKKPTTYVVTVQPTAVSFAATSAPTKVR